MFPIREPRKSDSQKNMDKIILLGNPIEYSKKTFSRSESEDDDVVKY